MLDECIRFLKKRKLQQDPNFTCEIIVVSDGSTDDTAQIVGGYTVLYSANIIRVLELETNRGKGGAVRLVCINQNK
jgi:glycosyltransferase involved in cell wall biosynthesis